MQLIHPKKLKVGQLIVEKEGPVYIVNEVAQVDGQVQVAMTDVLTRKDYFATYEPKDWLMADEPVKIELRGPHGVEGLIRVELARLQDEQNRPVYHYLILDDEQAVVWVAADLHGPVGGKPDAERAASALLSMLMAAGEAYERQMRGLPVVDDDVFNPRVGEWAYSVSDELQAARSELTHGLDW